MELTPVIGLEIHVQLGTKSKMFCSCPNDPNNLMPNTAICPVCMGHPGTLPTLNKKGVEFGVLLAYALHATIAPLSKFDRKNYFYPDLPKGYQISQFDKPIGEHGYLNIVVDGKPKRIGIRRLHLEEDAAKLTHTKNGQALVDFNRAGMPLVEIVTLPDFDSSEEAKEFLQNLRQLCRYLGVSDADMEKGQLRCDANISLYPGKKPEDMAALYPKTEVKNMNSFKSVASALEYEIQRQKAMWEAGDIPKHTTRGWDDEKEVTTVQRSKEEAQDYRFFPEPDLPPLDMTVFAHLKNEIPELPEQKRNRLVTEYGIPLADANRLCMDRDVADYLEDVISETREWIASSKKIAPSSYPEINQLCVNFILSNYLGALNTFKLTLATSPVTRENLAELICLLYTKKITMAIAKEVLNELVKSKSPTSPTLIVKAKGLFLIEDDKSLEAIASDIIREFPAQVQQYKAGKTPVLQFLIGQMMRVSKGKCDPNKAKELLEKALK